MNTPKILILSLLALLNPLVAAEAVSPESQPGAPIKPACCARAEAKGQTCKKTCCIAAADEGKACEKCLKKKPRKPRKKNAAAPAQ